MRRRAFVDAAVRVLERQGPGFSVDAVAAEAGITKPVLYRCFADKSSLVDALCERGSELLLARLVPAITCAGPLRLRIRRSVEEYFAVIEENPNLYRLVAGLESAGGHGAVRTHRPRERIAATLGIVMADYLRLLGLDADAAEPWAHGLVGLVQSTGEWWLRRRHTGRVQVVDRVTELIWSGLSGVLRGADITVDPDEPLPAFWPTFAYAVSEQPAC
jgi:AcrR family transcriptional regulator